MPAIALIDPSQSEVLAGLEAKAKQPNLFFRAMAHRPDVLKNFPPIYASIMGPGSVDRRIKELLYLACSYANKCAFCTSAHTAGARKAGITDDELHALKEEWDDPFTESERSAIHYAREMTRTADAMASRAALAAHFSNEQVVEITLVIAMANFTNRFNNGLQILPEA
jgi:uncharacterized peroxidase-related enzyme